jgi:hypothetical protein
LEALGDALEMTAAGADPGDAVDDANSKRRKTRKRKRAKKAATAPRTVGTERNVAAGAGSSTSRRPSATAKSSTSCESTPATK